MSFHSDALFSDSSEEKGITGKIYGLGGESEGHRQSCRWKRHRLLEGRRDWRSKTQPRLSFLMNESAFHVVCNSPAKHCAKKKNIHNPSTHGSTVHSAPGSHSHPCTCPSSYKNVLFLLLLFLSPEAIEHENCTPGDRVTDLRGQTNADYKIASRRHMSMMEQLLISLCPQSPHHRPSLAETALRLQSDL